MNTLEGNKLIAEFMGSKTNNTAPYTIAERMNSNEVWLPIHGIRRLQDLKYHTSWDWFLPCVFKIMDDTSIYAQERQKVYSSINRDISVTWQAVVKFIEWYNLQTT